MFDSQEQRAAFMLATRLGVVEVEMSIPRGDQKSGWRAGSELYGGDDIGGRFIELVLCCSSSVKGVHTLSFPQPTSAHLVLALATCNDVVK